MTSRVVCIAAACFVALSSLSLAESDRELGTIFVSGSPVVDTREELGSATTVITAEDIERLQAKTVEEALRHVPGVTVRSAGQSGSNTSVFIRGNVSRHTLVLVDGVQVNDPGSTIFDFANMTTDNVDRIEILRGPQSTVWGSDAIGGVINIITKRGSSERPTISMLVEGGSFAHDREVLSASGGTGWGDYSVSLSRLDTSNDMPNADFNIVTASALFGWNVAEDARLEGSFHFADSRVSIPYDGPYGFRPLDLNPNQSRARDDLVAALSFEHEIDEWWKHFTRVSLADGHAHQSDYPDPPNMETLRLRNEFDTTTILHQHTFQPFDWDTITIGGEFERTRAKNTSFYMSPYYGSLSSARLTTGNLGLFADNKFNPCEQFYLLTGFRYDKNSEWGRERNGRVSAVYILPNGTTSTRATYGTGFRGPQLLELDPAVGGNVDLKPEQTWSYEFGIDQKLFDDRAVVSVTYFHTIVKDLIDFVNLPDYPYFRLENVDTARIEGVEVEGRATLTENWSAGANATWLDPENREHGPERGDDLRRQPRISGGFDVTYQQDKFRVTLAGDAARRATREHYLDFDGSMIEPHGYWNLRLTGEYEVCENFKFIGRVENLLDSDHSEIQGYPPVNGRAFYIGGEATY